VPLALLLGSSERGAAHYTDTDKSKGGLKGTCTLAHLAAFEHSFLWAVPVRLRHTLRDACSKQQDQDNTANDELKNLTALDH
jgi:hypothetical protein